MWNITPAPRAGGGSSSTRSPIAEEEFMGISKRRMRFIHHAALAAFICGIAGVASAQSTPTEKPKSETAQPDTASSGPLPTFATLGPSRELKLGEYTWFRFAAQIQAWYRLAEDRIIQPDG